MPKYIYDYNDISFKLTIPDYWEKIYKGQPRKELYYDYCVLLDLVKKIDKSKWVIDVGSNHGIFFVPTSLLGHKVIGFEPVKSNFDNIKEAIQDNNLFNCEIFNLALSNENSEKDIYVPECLDNSSFSAEAAIANMIGKEYKAEKVSTVRFDDWIKYNPQYSNIGLIKMDTQGAEGMILEGMKEFLTNTNDILIICEYENHLNAMGYSFEQLDNLFLSYGFEDKGKIVGNDKLWIKK